MSDIIFDNENQNQKLTKELKKKRNSSVPVTGGEKKRLRHTNYFMTINTNQVCDKYTPEGEEMLSKFRDVCRAICTSDWFDKYVTIKEGAPEGSEVNSKWIKTDEVELHYAAEIGEVQKRLHCHIGVFIPHYTLLKIEDKLLKADIDKEMAERGWNSYHFKTVYGRDAGDGKQQLIEYITKDPAQ